jgi:hypothetical protein
MSADVTDSALQALNSWKEISAYMGRGIRTLQRYELEFGLPIRRINKSRRSVLALRGELDTWLQQRSSVVEKCEAVTRVKELRLSVEKSVFECRELRSQSQMLRASHRSNLNDLVSGIHALSRNLVATPTAWTLQTPSKR